MDEDTKPDIAEPRSPLALACHSWHPYALALFAVIVSSLVSVVSPPAVSRYALPLVNVVLFYPAFLGLVSTGQRRRALAAAFAWAGLSTVAVVSISILRADSFGPGVLNGTTYKEEMFRWITTGIGAESRPSQFLPKHTVHLVAFAVLSFLSVGFLGLAMGAVLLNYMNFYYGSLIAEAQNPWRAALLGWPIWAILRVAGYMFLGVALAELGRTIIWQRKRPDWDRAQRLLLPGGVLVVADVVLKTVFAPLWRILLARVFGIQY